MNNTLKILITFGPTREYIDPVRFISNASSGLMGFNLYKAFKKRFTNVFAITGPVSNINIKNYKNVVSAKEMYDEVKKRIKDYNIFISVAAVADYSADKTSKSKIKSDADYLVLKLKKNPDIISMAKKENKNLFSVGFSLETGVKSILLNNSIRKMKKKNMDIIIANTESNIGSKIKSVYVINKKGAYKFLKMDVGKIANKIAEIILNEYETTR